MTPTDRQAVAAACWKADGADLAGRLSLEDDRTRPSSNLGPWGWTDARLADFPALRAAMSGDWGPLLALRAAATVLMAGDTRTDAQVVLDAVTAACRAIDGGWRWP